MQKKLTYCYRCFNLELGLPLTGLDKLEEVVGVPDFSGAYSQDDYLANQTSHFQEHFASQIALRRLSMEFHNLLTNGKFPLPLRYVYHLLRIPIYPCHLLDLPHFVLAITY